MCGVPDSEVVGTGKWPEGPGRVESVKYPGFPYTSASILLSPTHIPLPILSANWNLPLPLSEVPL